MSTITTLVEDTNYADYLNPNGIWKISTEGDVEGRSTQELGIFEGNIRDILKNIGYKQYYNLFISKMVPEEKKLSLPPKPQTKCDRLNLYFETKYNVMDLNTVLSSLFPISENFFAKSTGRCSAVVYIGDNAKKMMNKYIESKKQKALEKLTDEEKMILGLI